MRILRSALLVLALFVPVAGVLCCVPDPADACCSEETACPVGVAVECTLTHAATAPTFVLDRCAVDAPAFLPTGIGRAVVAPPTALVRAPVDVPPRGSTDRAQPYPLRN